MKKNVTIRIACLLVALVMLGGALAFAAVMGSPYAVLRDAVLDALTIRNVTVNGRVNVYVDGMLIESTQLSYALGDRGSLSWNLDAEGNPISFSYESYDLTVRALHQRHHFNSFGQPEVQNDASEIWYSAFISPRDTRPSGRGMQWSPGVEMFTQEDRSSAGMRFGVLAVDALVGDLRNNITMSQANGYRVLRGSLTDSQIPELIRAGIEFGLEQGGQQWHRGQDRFVGGYLESESIHVVGNTMRITTTRHPARHLTAEERAAWDDGTFWDDVWLRHDENMWGIDQAQDGTVFILTGPARQTSTRTEPLSRELFNRGPGPVDPLSIPIRSLYLNSMRGEARVDSEGRLVAAELDTEIMLTNIFNEQINLRIHIDFEFSDFGTSNPHLPIPGARQILNHDYLLARLFEFDSYFEHEDGSIDRRMASEFTSQVFFTLNDDGTINKDSLTTFFPFDSSGRNHVVRIDTGGASVTIQEERTIIVDITPHVDSEQPEQDTCATPYDDDEHGDDEHDNVDQNEYDDDLHDSEDD